MSKTAFSARHQHVLSFSHFAQHFLAIVRKVHQVVQNSVRSTRSAHFVIFAPGTPRFSDFQQSERVCGKQRFQPGSARFVISALGTTIVSVVLAKCTSF